MKARTIGGCLALLLGLGLALPALAHSRATTKRVSVDSTGAQANRESFEPEISADGRYVAFESAASNLVADDTNGTPDVFVHDRSGSPQDQIEALAAIVQRLVDKGIPERGPRKGARGEAECCRKNPEEG